MTDPELAAAMTETRKLRDILANVLGSFGEPDHRRMRRAAVTDATVKRWHAEAGLRDASAYTQAPDASAADGA